MLLFLNTLPVGLAVPASECCCRSTRCCHWLFLRLSVVADQHVVVIGCSCVSVLLLINTLLSLAVPVSEF